MPDSQSSFVRPCHQPKYPPVNHNSSSFSFTQGFVLGQLSVCVLLFVFIKFFIFGEGPSSEASAASRARNRRLRSFASSHKPEGLDAEQKRVPSVLRPTGPLSISSILAKTYYNVHAHTPESVDWFNVLIAQTIAQLRTDAQADNAILTSLMAVLNGPRKPDFLDEIKVTEINLGEEFPIFSNCRVIPVYGDEYRPTTSDGRPTSRGDGGFGGGQQHRVDGTRLQARMDVDLSDAVTLGIETKLVLNYPRPRVAIMPVGLAVSVVRFSGTLSISFIPSPADVGPQQPDSSKPTSAAGKAKAAEGASSTSSSTPPTTLAFSFQPDYRLELSTHSLLGSRSRLQDVPKIAQLVEARLHAWFDERCVEPRFQQVVLPSLWPRKSNTFSREGDEVAVEDDEAPGSVARGGHGRTPRGTPKRGPLRMSEDFGSSPIPPLDGGLRHRRNSSRRSMGANAMSPMRDLGSLDELRMPGSLPP